VRGVLNALTFLFRCTFFAPQNFLANLKGRGGGVEKRSEPQYHIVTAYYDYDYHYHSPGCFVSGLFLNASFCKSAGYLLHCMSIGTHTYIRIHVYIYIYTYIYIYIYAFFFSCV